MRVGQGSFLEAEVVTSEDEGGKEGVQSLQFSQHTNKGRSELGCKPEVVVLEEGGPREEEGEEPREEGGGGEVGLDGGRGEGAGG